MKLSSTITKLWPYDASITISILALFVTCLQLIFTTPLLIDLYFKPHLIIRNEEASSPKSDVVAFRVVNEGSRMARNVEVGITAIDDDRLSVLPDLGASISHDDSVFIRNFRIVVPYLGEGESFAIVVRRALNSPRELTGQIEAIDGLGSRHFQTGPFPSISYLRSETGPGEVLASRFGQTLVPTLKQEVFSK